MKVVLQVVMGGVVGFTKLLLFLSVPHRATTHNAHLGLCLCLHSLQCEAFGAKQPPNKIMLLKRQWFMYYILTM